MQKTKHATFWLKGLGVLLTAMFIFTVISRATDSITVAKVRVSTPISRKIQYAISAEGRAEKNQEISVITQPDILVRSVLVNAGQRVEKGDVLAILDLSHLKEQIQVVLGEKRALELQNQTLEQNRQQERQSKEKAAARAKSDYSQLQRRNNRSIQKAKESLLQAKSAYRKGKKTFQKAQAALKKAQKEPENVRETLRQRAEKEKNALASLGKTVSEQRNALAELRKTADAEEKTAKRAIEDAMASPVTDHTDDINDISIQKLSQKIDKLQALRDAKGRITAPKGGVVTAVLTGVGQKTLDTAIFTMTDDRAGLKFIGQIAPKDAKHISAGDTVTLKSASNQVEVPITSMELDENKEFMNVTALLPADSFSLGETLSMNLLQESENYPCTLPLTALYDDNGKKYVLATETEDTVLGKQQIARKIEVKVLEQNDSYAALEADGIKEDSKIITDTESFVKAGDRVRIIEKE